MGRLRTRHGPRKRHLRFIYTREKKVTNCFPAPTQQAVPLRQSSDTIPVMSGLFDGTSLEQPVTCEVCKKTVDECDCPRSASGAVLQPKDQPARITREKRRNGKSVTVISGLDPSASDLTAILKSLKSSCATGGLIDDGKIEIQGDHRAKVQSFLQSLGYPVKRSGG